MPYSRSNLTVELGRGVKSDQSVGPCIPSAVNLVSASVISVHADFHSVKNGSVSDFARALVGLGSFVG